MAPKLLKNFLRQNDFFSFRRLVPLFFKLFCLKNEYVNNGNMGAAIALWIINLLNCVMWKMTKINKKRPGLAHV